MGRLGTIITLFSWVDWAQSLLYFRGSTGPQSLPSATDSVLQFRLSQMLFWQISVPFEALLEKSVWVVSKKVGTALDKLNHTGMLDSQVPLGA